AAVGALVGAFPRFERVDEIVHADGDEPAFDRATDDRQPDHRCKHLREERDHVDVQHGRVSFFARLFRFAPAGPPTDLERGARALRAGDLDAAWAAFDAALASAADGRARALARNKRALVLLARGNRAAALHELDDALALDPACVAAMVNVGNL